jgi:hypothetical protein
VCCWGDLINTSADANPDIDIIPEGGARAARGIFLVTMPCAEMKFLKGLCAECIFLDRRSTQLTFGMWILSRIIINCEKGLP